MKNFLYALPALIFGALLMLAAAHWSCSSTANILANIYNDTGCGVTFTLDGGSSVIETATGGPYTLYSNVSSGNHKIGVQCPYVNTACNYTISGGSQTVSVSNPCYQLASNGGNPGFVLTCQ